MGDKEAISAKVEHARQVERVLLWLGWLVALVGATGMAVYAALWAAGDLSAEQGVSLVLGTTLATALSGATAYGAGVNIGLGAERLQLAAAAPSPARHPELPAGRPGNHQGEDGEQPAGEERAP